MGFGRLQQAIRNGNVCEVNLAEEYVCTCACIVETNVDCIGRGKVAVGMWVVATCYSFFFCD